MTTNFLSFRETQKLRRLPLVYLLPLSFFLSTPLLGIYSDEKLPNSRLSFPMAAPQREAIEMFTSITGASQEVALQKLEEHGGDLNQAINAHFNEGDRTISPAASVPEPQDDFMAIDDPNPVEPPGSSFPLLSAARSLNPFSILDPNFRRSFFDGRGGPDFTSPAPFVSNPREVREIPIEFRDVTNHASHSGSTRPIIEDITESGVSHGPENYGTVLIDEKEDLPVHATSGQSEVKDDLYERRAGPSAPQLYDVTDDGNDIEEEMLRAAIEASKMEVELGYPTQQFGATDGSSEHQLDERSPHLDDTELARAVSLSLKTAEQEKALREQEKALCDQQDVVQTARLGVANLSDIEELERLPQANMRQGFGPANKDSSNQSKSEVGGSSNQEETDDVEEPLVRNSSKRVASGSAEASKEVGPVVDSIPSSPQSHDSDTPPQLNGDPFHSEWGGISSEEHDEAVMLEAALFGRIPEGSEYRFGYPPSEMAFPRRAPRPPSPTLTAQRLLREQQDDEYLASLQADREKELKAKADAEAAVELEKQKAEEIHRKLLEEEEAVRLLEAKEASLPQEPALDEEAGITLLVRMPDGSRRGRRFRKFDKLQSLFDFIDVGRGVKPGTYRLVRPYPRRAFSDGESEVSLSDLGLTSKQEALFLELI